MKKPDTTQILANIRMGQEYSNEKFSLQWGMFAGKYTFVYNTKGEKAESKALTKEEAYKLVESTENNKTE